MPKTKVIINKNLSKEQKEGVVRHLQNKAAAEITQDFDSEAFHWKNYAMLLCEKMHRNDLDVKKKIRTKIVKEASEKQLQSRSNFRGKVLEAQQLYAKGKEPGGVYKTWKECMAQVYGKSEADLE
jgi:chemotaxis response regulator CheB